jgi:DNA-directed RNA polymerase II subunit RPB1
MPFNPARVLKQAVNRFGRARTTELRVAETRHQVGQLLARIHDARRPYATVFTRIYLHTYLTLRNIAVVHCLSPAALEWVLNMCWTQFNEALAEPGEMVGTVGASSIGAPCTQMTLNTFHTAGVLAHTVTQGVPRLKELIDLSVKIRTPSLRIYMQAPYSTHEAMARRLGVGIEHTMLMQVVATSEVVWAPPDMPVTGPDADMVELNTALGCGVSDEKCSQCVIRFVLDRAKMCCKYLTVTAVGTALAAYLGPQGLVMWSEVNMLEWCVRVRLRGFDLSAVHAEGDETRELEMKATRTVHDYLLDNVPVHGVCGITRVVLRCDTMLVPDVTGGLKHVPMWSADTEGTNLHRVLALQGVDSCRTRSNDIFETLAVLGLEAATHQLLTEIRSVLSHDGAYVNDRHLQLLVDVMTHTGDLAPVTRHSMLKLGASVYTRASFEQTQDVLTWAAATGVHNPTHGVTENIMLGTPISGGTGACTLITESHAIPPLPTRAVVKPLVREIRPQGVAPLLAVANPLPVRAVSVQPKTLSKFVGKKRRRADMESQPAGRVLVLHSPTLRTGVRTFTPQSPDVTHTR